MLISKIPVNVEPQDVTIKIVEGDVLNITCRTLMYGRSSVSWLKDNKLIENEDEKTLFLGNVSRSQAGEYICVSLEMEITVHQLLPLMCYVSSVQSNKNL